MTSLTAPYYAPSDSLFSRTPSFSELDSSKRKQAFNPLPSLVQSIEYNTAPVQTALVRLDDPGQRTTIRSSGSPPQVGMNDHQIAEELRGPLSNHHIRADVLSYDNNSAFINHSAVLAENELSIGIQPTLSEATPMSIVSQSHIDRGATVLTLLKDLPLIQKYIDKWFSFAGGVIVIEPMVKIYLNGIWSVWHKALEAQKPEDLREMSARIWENTLKPASRLLDRNTTPQKFCSDVTGEFLRWEVIGIIVSLVSLLAQSLKGMLRFSKNSRPTLTRVIRWRPYLLLP